MSRQRESFDDATRRIEAEIRKIVSDPSLVELRITGPARRAAANDGYYSGLKGALKAIATKFGDDPAKASDRGRFFNTCVTRLDNKHRIASSPGAPQASAEGDGIPFD